MRMDTKKAYVRELLHRIALNDDKEAFKLFFNLYYTKLLQFALLFVPSRPHAEDIVSDVLIRLLQKRRQLVEIDNFEGYLFLAVKNGALSSLKKVSSRIAYHSIDIERETLLVQEVNPERKLLDDELQELIHKAVENLPPRRRMIYKMIKDDGMKYKQVAELLDITPKTVENHLDIAIKQVRHSLTQYLEEKQVKPLLFKVIQSSFFLSLLTC